MSIGMVGRLPWPIFSSYEWQQGGSCAGADSTLFFHPDGERGAARRLRDAQALALCSGCPVLEACRQHALSVREPYGVWGGTTETEREQLHIRTRARSRTRLQSGTVGQDGDRSAAAR